MTFFKVRVQYNPPSDSSICLPLKQYTVLLSQTQPALMKFFFAFGYAAADLSFIKTQYLEICAKGHASSVNYVFNIIHGGEVSLRQSLTGNADQLGKYRITLFLPSFFALYSATSARLSVFFNFSPSSRCATPMEMLTPTDSPDAIEKSH